MLYRPDLKAERGADGGCVFSTDFLNNGGLPCIVKAPAETGQLHHAQDAEVTSRETSMLSWFTQKEHTKGVGSHKRSTSFGWLCREMENVALQGDGECILHHEYSHLLLLPFVLPYDGQ